LHAAQTLKWKIQTPIDGIKTAASASPLPKIGKKRAERRFDQQPVKGVSEAGAPAK
jgi:hypothetical protein